MEKFKIELELTRKEIENIRMMGCIGLLVGNDGRADKDAYTDMALFIKKLNDTIGDNFGDEVLYDEVGTNELNQKIIKPDVKFTIPYIFNSKNILDLLEEKK